jgi:hypothetical protein
LPGLPMFGHGQIEGFTERYGMDFKQAMLDEHPNEDLVARHQHLIAPLLKSRHIFAGSEHFLLFDFWNDHGTVDENVFVYSNRLGNERALILYNNSYQSTHGTIHFSVGFLEKSSGAMQQKSLAFGLNLPNEDSLVIAYRDNVLGLEYLRRVNDIHDHGLTLSLRGYQHVALLKWQELRSTATHPWDRLCDALHGSGVYSIEEALSKLQIRPVLEALSQAVSAANIEIFATLSREFGRLERKRVKEIPSLAPDRDSQLKINQPIERVQLPTDEARNDGVPLDPRLSDFLDNARLFKERVVELSELDGGHSQYALRKLEASLGPQYSGSGKLAKDAKPDLSSLLVASLRLPVVTSAFPESLEHAVSLVLPSFDHKKSETQTWAPVLAWLVFQTLPPLYDQFEVFQKLNLRWALAETFSSVGLEGESAWKSAAQVSVLLKFGGKADLLQVLRTETFWKDPEVRWLAGVNNASGIEYINLERFDELLCWFKLPELLKVAALDPPILEDASRVAREITDLTALLQWAGYEYRKFLSRILLPQPQP